MAIVRTSAIDLARGIVPTSETGPVWVIDPTSAIGPKSAGVQVPVIDHRWVEIIRVPAATGPALVVSIAQAQEVIVQTLAAASIVLARAATGRELAAIDLTLAVTVRA